MTLKQGKLIFLLLWTFCACDREDEKIPSYLYIEPFDFSVRIGEGTGSQNLSDVWIYVNDHYYGAYELPCWIPVLESGTSEVLLIPGYRQDGRITNAFRYQLLNPFKITIQLDPQITDTIRPNTSYQSGLQFSVIEDFEGIHFFNTDRDKDPETKILLTDASEAFEGSHSGSIALTKEHPSISAEYILNDPIPQSGDPIILELNFKADIPFSIGFIGYKNILGEENLIKAGVLPKKNWTKVYFDFREIINSSNSDYYHLAIAADFQKDSSKAIQQIFIDNIKVIHR